MLPLCLPNQKAWLVMTSDNHSRFPQSSPPRIVQYLNWRLHVYPSPHIQWKSTRSKAVECTVGSLRAYNLYTCVKEGLLKRIREKIIEIWIDRYKEREKERKKEKEKPLRAISWFPLSRGSCRGRGSCLAHA